ASEWTAAAETRHKEPALILIAELYGLHVLHHPDRASADEIASAHTAAVEAAVEGHGIDELAPRRLAREGKHIGGAHHKRFVAEHMPAASKRVGDVLGMQRVWRGDDGHGPSRDLGQSFDRRGERC